MREAANLGTTLVDIKCVLAARTMSMHKGTFTDSKPVYVDQLITVKYWHLDRNNVRNEALLQYSHGL
jgi:hypothetical protein